MQLSMHVDDYIGIGVKYFIFSNLLRKVLDKIQDINRC